MKKTKKIIQIIMYCVLIIFVVCAIRLIPFYTGSFDAEREIVESFRGADQTSFTSVTNVRTACLAVEEFIAEEYPESHMAWYNPWYSRNVKYDAETGMYQVFLRSLDRGSTNIVTEDTVSGYMGIVTSDGVVVFYGEFVRAYRGNPI